MKDTLTPRRFLPFPAPDIPRHWLPGNPVVSAILNTYTVLVPANEAFYIRTLKHCLPRMRDDALRGAGVAFIHQEAQHGVAHKRYWSSLQAQGYRFEGFERIANVLTFRLIDRLAPLRLRVSLVSCVEYINAYIGYEFLSQQILAQAHPQMRALMEWHFAEEVEHKHVAFDVLGAVAPGYLMRVLGFFMTVPLFYLLMTLGTAWFLAQDSLLHRRSTWRQLWFHLGPGHRMFARTLRHQRDYLRRRFHPSQLDDRGMASEVIDRYRTAQPPWLVPTPHAEQQLG
ncbi:MAG: metal-dependent hydrolase [Luteimonas sp.]|nr:metal-dependent hydrolase [Luteimonas sp.]